MCFIYYKNNPIILVHKNFIPYTSTNCFCRFQKYTNIRKYFPLKSLGNDEHYNIVSIKKIK